MPEADFEGPVEALKNLHATAVQAFEDTKRQHFAQSGQRRLTLAEKIDDLFTYHAPEGNQPAQYEAIRSKAKELAHVIVTNTPECADQTAAIRKLREAVMTANAAIATKGLA